MRHTTRTHRADRRPGTGSTARTTAGGSSSANRHSSSALQRPERARPAATANHIIGGAVIILLGLGWAVGLAMTPGAAERQLLLKLIPWLLVAGGLALTIYGFLRLGPSIR
jgi:hypothetical protein